MSVKKQHHRGRQRRIDESGQISDKHRNALTQATEPQVGIFWLLGEKLVFDTCPLSQAEHYGDIRIHSRNHISVWEQLRSAKAVPPELEYEEPPRGRVMYDVKKGRFSILADRCILRRRKIVATIKKEMHLPRGTDTATDYHYRCFRCLRDSDDTD